MRPLAHPLYTPRLRIEPVTPLLAAAARAGRESFAEMLGADAPPDWCAASLGLVAASSRPSWHGARHHDGLAAPTRAVAVHRAEGVVICDVRFEPSGRAPNEVEIGYGVAASRRRQGYAVEAAGAVIDWLLAEGGAQTVIAGCDRRNLASVRTLRKLGFWLDSTPGTAFWWVIERGSTTSA